VSEGQLAGVVSVYAGLLVAASWFAERLAASASRRGADSASPWAGGEALRFRRGMARVVRIIAAFLLVALAVRLRGTGWMLSPLLLLGAVAWVEVAGRRGS